MFARNQLLRSIYTPSTGMQTRYFAVVGAVILSVSSNYLAPNVADSANQVISTHAADTLNLPYPKAQANQVACKRAGVQSAYVQGLVVGVRRFLSSAIAAWQHDVFVWRVLLRARHFARICTRRFRSLTITERERNCSCAPALVARKWSNWQHLAMPS